MKNKQFQRLIVEYGAGDLHSIVLIKDENITNGSKGEYGDGTHIGWSIFDPNGIRSFPFKITYNGIDVTTKCTEDLTPKVDLNYSIKGIDNPGLCSIYTILIMVFYYWYKDYQSDTDPINWLALWQFIIYYITTTNAYDTDIPIEIGSNVLNTISQYRGSFDIDKLSEEIIFSLISTIEPYIEDGIYLNFGEENNIELNYIYLNTLKSKVDYENLKSEKKRVVKRLTMSD